LSHASSPFVALVIFQLGACFLSGLTSE
jgi:hypothetical protein